MYYFNDYLRLTKNTRMSITDLYSSSRISIYNIKSNPHKKKKINITVNPDLPLEASCSFTDNAQIERIAKSVDENGCVITNPDSLRRAERRARVAVVDLARLNKFDYMVTFTISSEKRDLSNPYEVTRELLGFLDYYRQKNPNFRYLLVPEFGKLHGRLHFHGLVKGINPDDLFINEYKKLDFKPIKDNFGFVCIKKIQKSRADNERVAVYCGKYISKDHTAVKSHRYFCSKDLERPTKNIVQDGSLIMHIHKWLETFGGLKYYDDKCVCYDIPALVMEKLHQIVAKFRINTNLSRNNIQVRVEDFML